jgi:hypothetical protein
MSAPSYRTHSTGVREVFDANAYAAKHPDADIATCGECGRSWDDHHVTGRTPTPSARCPFEYSHR